MNEQQEKQVIFWFHALLQERINRIESDMTDIKHINHRLRHFKDADKQVKNEMMKQLLKQLQDLKWLDGIKQLKEFLKSEREQEEK